MSYARPPRPRIEFKRDPSVAACGEDFAGTFLPKRPSFRYPGVKRDGFLRIVLVALIGDHNVVHVAEVGDYFFAAPVLTPVMRSDVDVSFAQRLFECFILQEFQKPSLLQIA